MRKNAVAKGGAGPQEAGTRRGVLHAFGGVGRHEHEAQPIPDLELLRRRALVLSVGPAACGAGKVPSGHHDPVSLGMLIAGLTAGAVCALRDQIGCALQS
jgi:hypothetical protein